MHPWWELLGVRPGAMTAEYALHQRRAFVNAKKKVVFTARLLLWRDASKIKVDRVKMAAGQDVSTALFKAVLPAPALEKLAVAYGGKTVKAQFGLSPDDEYEIPPGVDFRTSLTIGERRKDRLGESCKVVTRVNQCIR